MGKGPTLIVVQKSGQPSTVEVTPRDYFGEVKVVHKNCEVAGKHDYFATINDQEPDYCHMVIRSASPVLLNQPQPDDAEVFCVVPGEDDAQNGVPHRFQDIQDEDTTIVACVPVAKSPE
jgi:hypothetical protein